MITELLFFVSCHIDSMYFIEYSKIYKEKVKNKNKNSEYNKKFDDFDSLF